MKKVNWPTRQETMRFTIIVIALSLAVAVFLGALDFVFAALLNCFLLPLPSRAWTKMRQKYTRRKKVW